MKITRQIETTLDIDDPIGFYGEGDSTLLETLARKYNGVCYAECKILAVTGIARKSQCFIDSMKHRHMGSLSVIFTAKVIVFNRGDVLHGCEVVRKDVDSVLCVHKNARVRMELSPLMKVVTVGQKIPVRVCSATYMVDETHVYVHAEPFLIGPQPWYLVNESLSGVTPAMLLVQEYVRKQEKKAESIKQTKGWKTFEGLFYPFVDQVTPKGQRTPIDKLPAGPTFVSRPSAMNRSEPFMYTMDSPPDGELCMKTLPPEAVICSMWLEYANHLRNMRLLCAVYATTDLVIAHKTFFAAVKNTKLA